MNSSQVSALTGWIRGTRVNDNQYGIKISDAQNQKSIEIDNVNGVKINGGLEIYLGGLQIDSGNTLNVIGDLSANGANGISGSYDIVCDAGTFGQEVKRFTFTKGILTSVISV